MNLSASFQILGFWVRAAGITIIMAVPRMIMVSNVYL
jgi:hypothetical protein